MIAWGRGSFAPSRTRKSRAGVSSKGRVGLPWDRNRTGIAEVVTELLKKWVSFLSAFFGRIEITHRAQTGMALASDDDVVVDRHADLLQGELHRACHLNIVA